MIPSSTTGRPISHGHGPRTPRLTTTPAPLSHHHNGSQTHHNEHGDDDDTRVAVNLHLCCSAMSRSFMTCHEISQLGIQHDIHVRVTHLCSVAHAQTEAPFSFRFPFSWRVTEWEWAQLLSMTSTLSKIFKKKRNRSTLQTTLMATIERTREAPPYLLWSLVAHVSTPIQSSSSSTQPRRPSVPLGHATPCQCAPRGAASRLILGSRPHSSSIETRSFGSLSSPRTNWLGGLGTRMEGQKNGSVCIRLRAEGLGVRLTAAAETFVLCFFAAGRRHAPPYSGGVFVAETNNSTNTTDTGRQVPRPVHIALSSEHIPPRQCLRSLLRRLGPLGSPRNALIGIPPVCRPRASDVCSRGPDGVCSS